MGLSSSQARLLHLTSRMHQIEYKAARLEAEKLQMANESNRVYDEYLNALEQTKIQYSTLTTDGAVTYLDATYNNLCMGYISNGNMYASPHYLGEGAAPEITGAVSGQGYQLVDAETGSVYVPEYVKAIYNTSSDAEDFANKMVEYINGNSTIAIDTTPPVVEDPDPLYVTELTFDERGNNATVVLSPEGLILTLKDSFDGQDRIYTINSDIADASVTLTYAKNGRLTISGNNLDILAKAGQADDIILIGNDNKIDTGDGNDTIRAGFARDMGFASLTMNNTILSGAGDDYIQVYGDNVIDASLGTDDMLIFGEYTHGAAGVENHFKDNATVNNLDGKTGWTTQGGYGNCRVLSLINGMGDKVFAVDPETGKPRVEIIKVADDIYKVMFNESGLGINVTQEMINQTYSESMAAEYGDLDNIIIERALNELAIMKEGKGLEECSYNQIAEILFGNNNVYGNNVTFENVKAAFDAFKSGQISNLIVGTGANENHTEGIIKHHAYAVKDVTGSYVELVNPWDSNDSIKLDAATFEDYFEHMFVFGEAEHPVYHGNGIYTNSSSTDPSAVNVNLGANSINSPYNYYLDLYDLLTSSGMIGIPTGMEHSTVWLSNVIQAGAVLKMLDSNNNWIDTSVSTDTHLQEVSDTTLIKKAEAKYEADMKKIDRKERKYDADLASFDNERNALKQEMDTLKAVAKDNVERTFKLFS